MLTKPLGTGIIATALKAGAGPDAAVAARHPALDGARSTASPPRSRSRHGVRAATDITGFGLVGHAANVARESRAHAGDPSLAELPLLPGARELAARYQPAGLKANRRQFEPLRRGHGRRRTKRCARCSTTRRPRAACSCSSRRRRRTRCSPS